MNGGFSSSRLISVRPPGQGEVVYVYCPEGVPVRVRARTRRGPS